MLVLYYLRLNPLYGMVNEEIIAKYRLNRECILELLETIAPDLQRPTNRNYPSKQNI